MNHLPTCISIAACRIGLVATFACMLVLPVAHAADFCVGTAGQLNSAIIAAETNDQSDEIRVREGTYVAPIPDGFYYYPPSNDSDVSNVTVWGGWNADCTTVTLSATQTVLSGNLQTPVLRFRNGNGTITVRNLTITGGYASAGVVGALQFDHGSGTGIGVNVDRVILHHNEIYAALYVKTQAPIVVEGSLFYSNLTPGTGAGGAVIVNENGFNATYIYNNTFTNNSAASSTVVGGLRFVNEGDGPSYIKNNILWGNDNSDLSVEGNVASQNDCGYNDIGVYDNVIVCNGAGVVQVNPAFTNPALEDFRLAINSPLIDIGCSATQCTGLPATDLLGIARPSGAGYEMGAYEGGYGLSDYLFADGFD
jgi:hypothetical protein